MQVGYRDYGDGEMGMDTCFHFHRELGDKSMEISSKFWRELDDWIFFFFL